MQRRETIPVMKKMRRLRCSVPWIYQERKQSSDGGLNREEAHMSVEGVVVRRGGMLCRGCFEGPLRRGRVLWWRTITWQLVGEEEWRNQGLIQAPGRRRVRMQRKLIVKIGQSF